jgi:hypothetical protein
MSGAAPDGGAGPVPERSSASGAERVPEAPSESEETVQLRRSPKILRFLLTGALVGAIVALILTFAFPPNTEYPATQVFGFLLLIGVAIGAAVGGLVAVVVDRALQRRARLLPAVREFTPPAPAPDLAADPGQGPAAERATGDAAPAVAPEAPDLPDADAPRP